MSKVNLGKVQQGLAAGTPNQKEFNQPTKAAAKPQTKLVSFKFDDETRDLLDELALTLCGSNKTLAVKTAILALADMPFEQQREALLKVGK